MEGDISEPCQTGYFPYSIVDVVTREYGCGWRVALIPDF